MKTFKVEGWHRYRDEKHFISYLIKANNSQTALFIFKTAYSNILFYNIDVKETNDIRRDNS